MLLFLQSFLLRGISGNFETQGNIYVATYSTCRIQNLDIPRAGRRGAAHSSKAGGAGAARQGAAGRGGAMWDGGGWTRPRLRRNDAPGRKPSILPPRAPKTTVMDDSSEARTKEILCKPDRGAQRAVDERFISGTKNALLSRFPAVDQWTNAFLSL